MALNPLAAVFVPHGLRKQGLTYTGWGKDGVSLRRKGFEVYELDASEGSISLTDVPKEIIATIFEKLQNPIDVLAAAMVNKCMLQIASEAALKLRVAPEQIERSGQSLIRAIHKQFSGVRELNFSGCSMLEDAEIVVALAHLPSIEFLDVSSCRKLTPGFLRQALQANFAALSRSKGRSSRRSLRVLGLQRCFQLDSFTLTDLLRAAASTHPSLSVIALSHLTLDKWPVDWTLRPLKLMRFSQDLPKLPAALGIECTALKILALHNCKKIAADGLAYLAACCPELEMLLLGGSTLDILLQEPSEEPAQAAEMPMEASNSLAIRGPFGCRDLRGFRQRCAAALVDAVQALSKLVTLEVTFFNQQIVAKVAEELPAIQIWEFTKPASLGKAHQLREAHRGRASFSGIALALSAAASCSDNMHTPLHDAVSRDCRYSLEVLLELGVSTEAKDQRGATPLFLACESNRLGCAAALLRAGAEIRARNSSGEAPLYIAALCGHERVVEALLAAFWQRGLKWMESNLYGDDFTPLMAATVADRHAIAMMLLRAAGPEAEGLVMATNRYGQSASHIAARRGSHLLLRAFIQAAGGLVALMPDNNGRTPLAVARANNQAQAIQLLQQAANAFQADCAAHTQHPNPPRHPGKGGGKLHGGSRSQRAVDGRRRGVES